MRNTAQYILKRLLYMIPMVLVITFLIYGGLELTPGDAISHMIPPDQLANVNPEQLEALRESYGLNDPFLLRYVRWLGELLHGNFGYSITSGVPIKDILLQLFPATLELSLAALAISSVLGSIADSLAQAGDAMNRPQPDSFAAWKRRLERKWKNGGQTVGIALTAIGWTFTGCFGITALVMGILTAVGAGPLGLTHDEFMAIPILFGVFTPVTLGFLFMAVVGTKQMTYFSRLRRLLRAANDWTCDLPSLARKAQIKQETAYDTVTRAVGSGDLPNAAISDDYSTLYLDDSLMPTAVKPAAAPQAEPAEPLTDAEQFRREGMDFLNYLKVCRGKLGTDADEELAAMQKTCASIMGFVHNHPEQLNRVRRFREYYLPTTRKLLDTAQGLGDTDSANAAEIRRDITGILHTLNQAYEKLYDTLLQDVSMDVSTEIDTLEAMLRQDGLTHDFEADFNTRS